MPSKGKINFSFHAILYLGSGDELELRCINESDKNQTVTVKSAGFSVVRLQENN